MTHLAPFEPRAVMALSPVHQHGWTLKRYAVLAEGRAFDDAVAEAASDAAVTRLPQPGVLADATGNHGVGFQIIHFAETAVVAPLFYWQWGSVLAHGDQLRAPWSNPTEFATGATEVFGCVWEMDIVTFEVAAWKRTVLSGQDTPEYRLARYLAAHVA
ncbi:hypothetical protein [uncultured Tateyamaria sp.]|uniref:hypothetical protein n=1 Tax=uncultured Tateyamaria sp. TaxID=455651 RepID=UPI002639EE63|nr:hypothetical protein [uncultured Tateyamaria sp.]